MADPPKPSLIIGQRGVQYGLQVRKAPGAAAKPAAARPAAVFGMDSDSDDDVGAQVARQAAKKQSDAKVSFTFKLQTRVARWCAALAFGRVRRGVTT